MIAIVDYGIGNLTSVRNAFVAERAQATITSDPKAVRSAEGIVVPGVGAFGRAMQNLAERQLIEPIKASVQEGNPFLGICLGLQLLFTESSEGGRFRGLDIIPGTVERLEARTRAEGTGDRGGRPLTPDPSPLVPLKVPHIGWNQIEKQWDCPELEGVPDGSFFYFVHSYHAVPEDNAIVATKTEYGEKFVSAIKKDNIFACQFHPERSGDLGLRIIRNFLRLTKAGPAKESPSLPVPKSSSLACPGLAD